MPDRQPVFPELTRRQLDRIGNCYGRGRTLLDAGCGRGEWVRSRRKQGHQAVGLMQNPEAGEGFAAEVEGLYCGAPAASLPFQVHAFDAVLLRGMPLFEQPDQLAEVTIALANFLSCLKPKGALVIPLIALEDPATRLWQERLKPFSLRSRTRTLSGGILSWLTPARLFGRESRVTVLEFRLQKKPVSRLQWHQLARDAVLKRDQKPAAA